MSMSKERAEDGFRRAALVDYLTGIYNRRAFIEEAERTISREARKGRTVSLVIFDLDHFKRINDEHGHPVGDRVLRSFCSVASQLLPAGGIFGRLGGEEFAALIADVEIEQAYGLADQIREAFAKVTVCAGGKEVRATTSAGVASSPQAQVGLSELLSGADAALYVAKSMGRNNVRAHGLDEQLVAGMRQRAERERRIGGRAG
jgi:diguanylate cyclase (GGDEF)-like protein